MALTNIKTIQNSTQVDLLNYFYPVGTTYITFDSSFNPNTTWGGTWVQIKNKFLYATSNSSCIGTCHGSSTATLKTCNLPSNSFSTGGYTCSYNICFNSAYSCFTHLYNMSQCVCCYTVAITGNYCNISGNHTCCYTTYYGSSSDKFLVFTTISYQGGSCCTCSQLLDGYLTSNTYASICFPSEVHSIGGNSCPFEIIPPYIAAFLWRRTA